jgi:hypothetical protein
MHTPADVLIGCPLKQAVCCASIVSDATNSTNTNATTAAAYYDMRPSVTVSAVHTPADVLIGCPLKHAVCCASIVSDGASVSQALRFFTALAFSGSPVRPATVSLSPTTLPAGGLLCVCLQYN